MKKRLLHIVGLFSCLAMSAVSFGQTASQNQTLANPEEKCGSAIIHERRMQEDPAYAQMNQEMEAYIANYVPTKVNGQYRIPIVVHVVYYTSGLGLGLQAITDDQIRDAVRVLNERFRNLGSYNHANGLDTDIEFALAVRDPSGNCTNGITRDNAQTLMSAAVFTEYQNNGVEALGTTGITDAQIKAVNQWPSNQYFNIWLIPEFDNNGGGAGVQGYASFATAHGTTSDGSVMLGLDFINPSSTTFTHELGHSFNLYHTFEGDGGGGACPPTNGCGANQGDCCADTPAHRRSSSDCNAAGTNTCTGGSNALFVYNYMDYSSCGDRFTANQRTRMQAAASGTRGSFLAANGNNKLIPPTAPGASVSKASKSAVCLGESLQLFDVTSCIPNDYLNQVNLWPNFTFAWVITNGTETINSSNQNPVITPTTSGVFNVTLTITHTTLGTFTSTTNGLFIVVPAAVTACTSTSSNPAGNYGHTVSNVTFNTINNNTDQIYTPIYTNSICAINTVVNENQTYPISVRLNATSSGSNRLQVMIDWNNDGTFNDAGEGWGDINGDGDMTDPGEGYLLTGNAAANATNFLVSGNITIPATAVENVVLRMRVIGAFNALPTTAQKNCTSQYTICDIEDYGIVVKGVVCAPVATTHPTSATICQNGNATFTAAFSNTPTSYVWQVSTNGGGAWTNLANGAPYSNVTTASMTITGAGIALNSYQYRCVATNGCGSGNSNAATLTVNAPVTPSFAAVGPYCSGASVPALPTTSTNGITGTWSPAINNTATTTYTFTPTAGQCATTTTLTITINPNVTPTFGAAGPYCSGASVPALPTTSTNGITGTWSPAINNTATTTYTFTPTAGQCATTTTKTITITPNVTPSFAAVGPYCSGASVPALPTTSTNGITGTWSPAINNTATTTYTFTPTAGQCATTTTLTITINPNVTPTFGAAGPYCSGASVPALPTTSTNGITGTWSPAINNTATTTYTFTPTAGQCATTTTKTITITPNVTPSFAAVGPYCSGASVPALPTTSTNGITGTWSPAISNTATTTYTFTPTAGQCATTTTLTITINPNVTPTFGAAGPYCSGASVPALPTTSTNGITGTWSPAINNTATTTYTFTPTAGQCATTTTKTITITPNVTPTFGTFGPYCSGASVPALPTTSNNGITGTWSPAINNTATTTYTFTPGGGQCSTTPVTTTITINPNVTPSFAAVGPYCSGASIPALPTTSTNGITGTWSPAINNTATTTYTFTPTAGQCATTTTLTITVTPNVTPTFAASGPYCSGASVPALPTTSNNGITGTWSPAINNTATTTYTFTPTAGQCGSTTTLTITITPNVTPTFNSLAAVCQNAAAPSLPTTSTNGISGTWSPATFSTASAGTFTSTFTPTAGQCATTTTLSLTVNPSVAPTFAVVPPQCVGATPPSLPTTSTNGITGTWSPATINTGSAGTTTHTFTPTAGQCSQVITITVTVGPPATPTFTQIQAFCAGSTAPVLPATSTNGITGTWSPATVSNTASGTYTFTPNGSFCATSTTMSITVNPVVTPAFTQIPAFCSGTTAPTLPATSTNGIPGTWSPATVSNTATGTYTFTPGAGQCASTQTMTITVNPSPTVTFGTLNEVCIYDAAFTLTQGAPAGGTYSGSGVSGGQFNPATAGLGTSVLTYSFTAGNGCSGTAQSSIVVDECLGVDDQVISSIHVFPNPSTGSLTIDAGTDQLLSVTVFDHLGKLVLNKAAGNAVSTTLDLSFVADGVYTIRIITEGGTQHVPVVIKK